MYKRQLITNNGRLYQRVWFTNDTLEDFFDSGVHTLRLVTTDTQRHREQKTPPAPLHLWEVQRVWYIEFGALQLACTPDLLKRPQNKSKSWQEFFALFVFTNKQENTTFLAICSTILYLPAGKVRHVSFRSQPFPLAGFDHDAFLLRSLFTLPIS